MTSSTSGACCVCGKETTQRCGACGRAGFSLFFCSLEHQKLVWFAHKPFCGPNSKPFTFPLLSKEEAQKAQERLHNQYAVLGGPTVSLADELVALHFDSNRPWIPNCEFESFIDSLQMHQSSSTRFSRDERNQLLCTIRGALRSAHANFSQNLTAKGYMTRADAIPLEYLSPLFTVSKFASRVASTFQASSMPPFPSSEEWYIEALHTASSFSALNYLVHQEVLRLSKLSPPPKENPVGKKLGKYIWDTAQRLVDLGNDLRQANPTAGQAVLAGTKAILMGSNLALEQRGGRACLTIDG
ncbi:hypothetical protein JCM8097_000063 [Rhodosporidiobolus ruineniae]